MDKYYLRQRYYDTWIGRFTRRDTYEGNINNPVSLHKYLYANADPVNGTDPSGLVTLSEIAAARHIRNVLAETQFDSYSYLVAASLGSEEPTPSTLGWDTLFTLGLLASSPIIAALTVVGTAAARQAAAITRVVGKVTNRYGIGQCDTCARIVKEQLKLKNITGKHIRIETIDRTGFNGNIYSNTVGDLISNNGYHEGIEITINGVDTVFDNIHKHGIPKDQWYADFDTLVPLTETTIETF